MNRLEVHFSEETQEEWGDLCSIAGSRLRASYLPLALWGAQQRQRAISKSETSSNHASSSILYILGLRTSRELRGASW